MTAKAFVFPAVIEPGDEAGFVVSFPDVPEAITQGDDLDDAREMAEEALGLALLSYVARGLPLPKPKTLRRGMVPVAVSPMWPPNWPCSRPSPRRESRKRSSPAGLGRTRRRCAASSIRDTQPNSSRLRQALRVLGKRLVVAVEKAA